MIPPEIIPMVELRLPVDFAKFRAMIVMVLAMPTYDDNGAEVFGPVAIQESLGLIARQIAFELHTKCGFTLGDAGDDAVGFVEDITEKYRARRSA